MGLWDSDRLPTPRVPHGNFTLTGLGGIKRKTNGNWCWGPLGVPGQGEPGSEEAAQVDQDLRVWHLV